MKAVVDTNLVISGLISKTASPYELVRSFRAGAFILVVSEPLRIEYALVLSRPKFTQKYGLTQEEANSFLLLVDTIAHRIVPMEHLPVTVRDAKDERVMAAALGGAADYLVTGDDDLLCLRDDPRIAPLKIVTGREFVEILGTGEPSGT